MRILIVEDEPQNASGLAAFINNLYPDDVCVTACDGREGLDKLRSNGPFDLVFADIQMPVMTGLEFLKAARQSEPELRVVILSAYDSFSYAREALRYNAMDYFLKPMQPHEISNLLEHVHTLVDEAQQDAAYPSDYMQGLIGRYLTSGIKLSDTLRATLPEYPHARMILADGAGQSGTDEFAALVRAAADSALNCHKNCRACLPATFSHGGRFILIAFYDTRDAADADADWRDIIDALKCPSLRLVTGGAFSEPINSAPKEFRRVDALAECLFYIGDGHALSQCELADEAARDKKSAALCQHFKALTNAVLTGDAGKAEAAYDRLAAEASAAPYMPPFDMLGIASGRLDEMREALRGRLTKSMVEELFSAFDAQMSDIQERLSAYLSALHQLITACTEAVRSVACDRNAAIFYEVLAYIKENLSDPLLSQKDVSDHFYFSASYFSTMFKKHTKQSFIIYLSEERIALAKRLLLDPDMNIVSIAAACGFQNAGYFSRVFKKHTGLTPQEYRRRCALGQRVDDMKGGEASNQSGNAAPDDDTTGGT